MLRIGAAGRTDRPELHPEAEPARRTPPQLHKKPRTPRHAGAVGGSNPRDTTPQGVPCRKGYHAARDTMSQGVPCRKGYHAARDTTPHGIRDAAPRRYRRDSGNTGASDRIHRIHAGKGRCRLRHGRCTDAGGDAGGSLRPARAAYCPQAQWKVPHVRGRLRRLSEALELGSDSTGCLLWGAVFRYQRGPLNPQQGQRLLTRRRAEERS
jgi:hypothetical protein